MKRAAVPFAVAIVLTSGIALAQGTDPMAKLRDCSPMERAERLECLDRALRSIAPAYQQAPKGDNWTISLTTSPVDYSPVATATTSSRDGAGESAMNLSIRCRGGRTELVVAGPSAFSIGDDYTISYRVNEGQQVRISAAVAASQAGIAFGGDVVRLLQSLPDSGSLNIHLASRSGTALDGTFSLVGLDAVRTKMVAACRWPLPVANPTGAGVR
jgi:hypothetical protein